MDLPAELLINGTLEQGYIYHYPDGSFTDNTPHFFIVLNKSPQDDSFIILTNATSRVEKVKQRILARKLPDSTFVQVKLGECRIFSKETAFDCNEVHKRTKGDLIALAQKGKLILKGKIPNPILQKILTGVVKSPRVEEKIKKRILS